MHASENRGDVFRTLYVNAENGMNLRLLHEGLMRLDPAMGLPSCGELVLGRVRMPDQVSGEEWEDEIPLLLQQVESRAEELGLLRIWRREETLALLGVAKRLARLGVQEVVVGDLPLPPGHCRNDIRRELLSRFSGHVSERAGVGTTAALLLDVLGAEQCGEICGRPVLASQIVGEEGTPFTLVLMEIGPGDDMPAWGRNRAEALPPVEDRVFEDRVFEDRVFEDGAFEDGARAVWPRENAHARARLSGECGSFPDGDGLEGDGFFETIVQFETNVDHITGEEAGAAIDALTADSRVLDALWLSGLGKKNRPTGLLRVLCQPCHRKEVLRLVLRHTHTLGVREQEIRRFVARRLAGNDQLPDQGEVSAKHYRIEGRWYSRPESDDVVRRAAKKGVGAPALRFGAPGTVRH